MPELNPRDLLRDWEKALQAIAGRPDLTHRLLEPMRHQLELVEGVVERERRLQRELTGRLLGPLDAVFDLLEQSGEAMARQAEALEAAGRALEETAALMKGQAELFERTVATLRQPTELARAVSGLEPHDTRRRRAGDYGRRTSGSSDAGTEPAS